jgi:hypothetical protein
MFIPERFEDTSHWTSTPKHKAQRALCTRTHWADEDTLRFFYSKILRAVAVKDGLAFLVISSDATDFDNSTRAYRWHLFDVFATHVAGPDIEAGFTTRAAAEKAADAYLAGWDAKAHTTEAIAQARRRFDYGMEHLAASLDREPAMA